MICISVSLWPAGPYQHGCCCWWEGVCGRKSGQQGPWSGKANGNLALGRGLSFCSMCFNSWMWQTWLSFWQMCYHKKISIAYLIQYQNILHSNLSWTVRWSLQLYNSYTWWIQSVHSVGCSSGQVDQGFRWALRLVQNDIVKVETN